MSAYPSPTIFNPDSALTPPDMPTVPLIGLKRRKFSSQDEDAGASRIPVKSPPRSTLGTPFGYGAPQSPTPNKKSSVKFATKSSIPFPKSSKPAPPVVTNAPGVIQYTTQASKVDTQRPPLHPGRLPPSTVAKGHEKDGKCQVETDGTAWKTLLQREKAIVAQTLDRDLLRERRWPYKATWLTPGLLRRGLHEDDSVYHAWTAFKRAIQGRPVEDWDVHRILSEAMNRYLVALGVEQLGEVDGLHFTFLDPRKSGNARALVRQAKDIVDLFEAEGYGKRSIVFSIPATQEGVEAAMKLKEKHDLKTNLLFVSGLAHAAICAQAGASFVTFPYRTLTKASVQKSVLSSWNLSYKTLGPTFKRLANEAIEATAEYFEMHGIATQIVVSAENVTTLSEALCVEGFDAVVLDTDQSLEARECLVEVPSAPMHATTGISPAKIRAQETPYPILPSMDGAFMSAMPAQAQSVAELTLQDTLEEWQVRMNMVASHMGYWIRHEVNAASATPNDVERRYTRELEKMAAAHQSGGKLQRKLDIGENDVGFRMARTLWDRPEAWC